jgi:NAD(P)H-hydrate epimerase
MPPFTLSRNQVRELDRRASEEFGVPSIVLMENAGRGCAELLIRMNPVRMPVEIVCGPGNNGGDGFVIARILAESGYLCRVYLFGKSDSLTADAKSNYAMLQPLGIECFEYREHWDSEGKLLDSLREVRSMMRAKCWIVDALFGTGLTRPLGPPFDEVVAVVNASRNSVLAVDLPSGLDCDTGEPLGPTVRATHTATFVAPKKGFLNPKSKEWTGEVHVIDIGVPRVLVEQYRG